jgi:hypothetical protein
MTRAHGTASEQSNAPKADATRNAAHFFLYSLTEGADVRQTRAQGRRSIPDGEKQTATTRAAAAFLSHSRTNRVRLTYGRGERT